MAKDADIKVMEGIHLRGSGDFAALAGMRTNSEVWMWDTGPEKPVQPKRPPVPKGREGDPDFDLALIEFKRELAEYTAALEQYGADKRQYEQYKKVGFHDSGS